MKNTITYAQALTVAIETITDPVVVDRLTTLRETLAKRSGHTSDEAKAKANAKRKAKVADARAQVVATVAPILRNHLTADITAKELFEVAQDELPEGFTVAKVQNILLREMAPELVRTERKGKANLYRMA